MVTVYGDEEPATQEQATPIRFDTSFEQPENLSLDQYIDAAVERAIRKLDAPAATMIRSFNATPDRHKNTSIATPQRPNDTVMVIPHQHDNTVVATPNRHVATVSCRRDRRVGCAVCRGRRFCGLPMEPGAHHDPEEGAAAPLSLRAAYQPRPRFYRLSYRRQEPPLVGLIPHRLFRLSSRPASYLPPEDSSPTPPPTPRPSSSTFTTHQLPLYPPPAGWGGPDNPTVNSNSTLSRFPPPAVSLTTPPGGFTVAPPPAPTNTSPDFRHQLSLYHTSREDYHHRPRHQLRPTPLRISAASCLSTAPPGGSPSLRHQLRPAPLLTPQKKSCYGWSTPAAVAPAPVPTTSSKEHTPRTPRGEASTQHSIPSELDRDMDADHNFDRSTERETERSERPHGTDDPQTS
ncbi:hypothetical protein GE061_020246, partial [Apolygus lucorum]